ncbi:MAG: hypothetical protein KKA84_15495 [Bacteroidetes bacterium]|nr:hypothetical protein [Bacteroidota bacterium]
MVFLDWLWHRYSLTINKKEYMRTPHIKFKAIIIAGFFSIIVASAALYIDNSYEKLSEDVIKTNMELCEVLATQLKTESQSIIDSLHHAEYFSEGYKGYFNSNEADKLLSEVSERIFRNFDGLEGGFFIKGLEEFQGYSYPTSPPPIPVYGPPPRSYNFIKEQVLQSINNDSLIVQLHKFDPAIFPLVTRPIEAHEETIGAIWVRTHIEKELPELTLVDILNITAVVSLLGFILAVTISIQLRNRIEKIRGDLERLEYDPDHRLSILPGIFGFISKSVNKMVDALQSEHNKREVLERELHQKDKMASLGKLIAGVAHEVKTPLAIIKTRIQIWQKKISSINEKDLGESFSNESMQMVINEINRLSNLVNRLLIFSKPVNEHFKATNVNQIILTLLDLYKNKLFLDNIEINLKLEESLPDINVDPDKIEQVIINLLTNSVESITSDGVINIQTNRNNGYMVVTISDNGMGIPVNVQKNVLDPFFTTKDKGTGLGLSIAYEIVKAHRGKIEFSSNESVGSEFRIFLPIKNSD